MSETNKPYGEQTVAELRTAAKLAGVTGYSRMKRGDLLNAILEWERAAVAVADRPVTFPEPSETDAAIEEALPIAPQVGDVDQYGTISEVSPMAGGKFLISYAEEDETAGSALVVPLTDPETAKSVAKAERFVQEASDLGWVYVKGDSAATVYAQTPGIFGVTVARGGESIIIEWDRGVFQGDTCYYSHSARTPIKLRNASHAKKVMAIPAATADEEARKVSAHKVTRPIRKSAAEATTERRMALPFDPGTALDQEILDALYGRRISWTNEISGAIEEERVPPLAATVRLADGSPGTAKQSHAPRIRPGKSGRSIEFVCGTGFRSVRVSSIVAVR